MSTRPKTGTPRADPGEAAGARRVRALLARPRSRYGRIFFGIAADYSLTSALTLTGITNVSWTDTAVDTKGTSAAATALTPSGITTAGNPFKGGKERSRNVYKTSARMRVTL